MPADEALADDLSSTQLQAGNMSLVEHLGELRSRIIKSLLAIGAGTAAAYFWIDKIIVFITASAGQLYYFSPAEAFFTYFKVAMFAGLLLVLPFLLYQVWAFVIPALTKNEFKAALILLPLSVVLFYGGLAFAYLLVLPPAIAFFIGFATDAIRPMFSLGQYVSFVLGLVLPFGLVFELPLFLIVLAKAGIITSTILARYRKYMIVMSFVAGGVISPTPDIFGQTMLAIPILALYEGSIFSINHFLHR